MEVATGFARDEKQIVPGNVNVPTQVANPKRTTLRSFVQAAVGMLVVLVPLVNGVLTAVQGVLKDQTDVTLPAWVYLWINTGIVVTSFIIALVARIMAVPGVADFIARHLPWLAPIKPAP
ncbi:hypothetical protein [Naasia sp. SYSU D00948]|uniref:hypothetical protein n=1 Tax=Naasia sp. SYSU D00948 TaxID=2817379 RepID=UPI001B312384|nr:hypothetical protein [Naasia sp. SYSU D00948]